MKKFKETYERLLAETRRAYYTREEVENIFDDLMKSVGPYFEKETWPIIVGKKDVVNLTDITQIDALRLSVAKAYGDEGGCGGVNQAYKSGLKKDGYHILIAILDELDLWREYPAVG